MGLFYGTKYCKSFKNADFQNPVSRCRSDFERSAGAVGGTEVAWPTQVRIRPQAGKDLAHLRSALRCMHGTNIGTAVPTGKYQVPATMYLKVPER